MMKTVPAHNAQLTGHYEFIPNNEFSLDLESMADEGRSLSLEELEKLLKRRVGVLKRKKKRRLRRQKDAKKT